LLVAITLLMTQHLGRDTEEVVLPLYAEDVSITRRMVERGAVRIHVQTKTHEHLVDEALTHARVEIERIAIGRPIDAVPPVRMEGDTIVISVVEEVLVVERRLILKEEIRLQRVQTTERYCQSVILREQEAVIERVGQMGQEASRSSSLRDDPTTLKSPGEVQMTNETIVAVYDTKDHAAAAVQALENAGVPSSAITQHSKNGMTTDLAPTMGRPAHAPGFWASLFGGEPDRAHDITVYDQSLEEGSTVVTVKAPEQYRMEVMAILERHNPIDIDERAARYDVDQMTEKRIMEAPLAPGTPAGRSTDDQTMQLAEETLAVGKRVINRGTTRIRRYVVETPVEKQVTLYDETVAVERRPVMDSRPVTDANFTDKVVEMTETGEEAVVSKTAHIKEEVVIRKDATERTETIRDTVRREDVEITQEAKTDSGAATTGITARPIRDPNAPKV
jgi:uncharacterized protein (TIGR02271 family)